MLYILQRLFQHITSPKAIKNSYVSKKAKVMFGSQIHSSKINSYSYVGSNCQIIETEIGKFCSLGNNIIIGGANHPKDWVSTSPLFHEGNNIFRRNFSTHPFEPYTKTIIKNDVWIGNNAIIMAGVEVGNGAIIGAGSVVTKDVEDYTIVAGNPARVINRRFGKNITYHESILKIQWWDFSENKLKDIAKHISNPEKFIDYIKNK